MPKSTYATTLLILLSIAFAGCDGGGMQAAAKIAPAEPQIQPGGYSNIDNNYLQGLIDKGITVVDIRRQEEWRQTGILKGSKTITFFSKNGQFNPNFAPQFTALVSPDEPVVLICRTGNRTIAASQAIAQQLGYQNVMNVTDGITQWIKEGRPVEKYVN